MKQQGKSADAAAEFIGQIRSFTEEDQFSWQYPQMMTSATGRQTLVVTPKYDHNHHHNKEESNKSYHSIIKYYI